ncbi:hypothetical protein IE077_001728 [Cardiosporidium cionae]|uniref:Uncharacterized protein n=1 Tax=Cardiosporidium cionae TaxID=476202 RepID=A0ABQ7JCI5_9APIC|nr:hypothetical protein IE077_001728 [Cardiosporidium cionae]|eukprot:KAF8821686.1 hypothetical protein IE077_001728 [Cardiosporidium cionae]
MKKNARYYVIWKSSSYNRVQCVDFYRFKHEIHGGNWLWPLPEVISPGNEIMVVGESQSLIAAVNGMLQYSCVFCNVDFIVQITFIVPLLDNISLNSRMLINTKTGRSFVNFSICQNYFYLKNVSLKSADNFEVFINGSMEGRMFIQARRMELHDQIRRLQAKHPGAILPYEALQQLSKHFTWNVQNADWQKALRQSYRSVLVRIVNLTQYTIELMNNTSTKAGLYEGKWMEFPSEQIPPMCFTEFGSKSVGLMTGTSGTCFYSVLGNSSRIQFSWEHPGLGPLMCSAAHIPSKFSIPSHIEKLNDGFIIFHVIDPTSPPRIYVDHAIEIPAIIIARIPPNHLDTIVSSHTSDRANWVQELLDYAEEGEEMSSSIGFAATDSTFGRQNQVEMLDEGHGCGVIRLSLSSPRAFFWSLLNRTVYKGNGEAINSINPTSHLLLKWRIGCEVFSHIWGPDEPILLNSLSPGGFENADVVKRANLLQFRRIPPLEFFARVLSTPALAHPHASVEGDQDVTSPVRANRITKFHKRFEFSDQGIVDMKERWALRHAYLAQSSDMLVGVAFECFRAVSRGLQPIILDSLSRKYGKKWKEAIKLPNYRVWSQQSLDLEYLLRLLIEHMEDMIIRSPTCKDAISLLQRIHLTYSIPRNDVKFSLMPLFFLFIFTLSAVIKLCQGSRDILVETGAQDVISTVENLLHMLGEDLESKRNENEVSETSPEIASASKSLVPCNDNDAVI